MATPSLLSAISPVASLCVASSDLFVADRFEPMLTKQTITAALEFPAHNGGSGDRTPGKARKLVVVVRNAARVPLIAKQANIRADLFSGHHHCADQEVGGVKLKSGGFHQ
jgi:hypothetical protein